MRNLLLVCTIIPQLALGQVSDDALGYFEDVARFSYTQIGGSARAMGMGGVQTALGADVTAANINPAGLAMYNRSEFSISPGLQFLNTKSAFTNPTESGIATNKRANFNIGNFGVVLSGITPEDTESKNKGSVFAITYNRINNFQNIQGYNAENNDNSMRNHFLETMEGTPWYVYADQFADYDGIIDLEGLAYWSWLANEYPADDDSYYTFDDGTPVSQKESVITRGAQYQWDLSYGTNINDKFYLGFGLGVVRSRYNERRIYEEENLATPVDGFLSFQLTEEYKVRGTGVNFSAGIIGRPADALRLGLSYQSPTFNSIKETWSAGIDGYYTESAPPDETVESAETLELQFDYNMTTPHRVNTGIAYFFGKNGFVSADLEYVINKSASLSNKSKNELDFFGLFDGDNETILNTFKNVINVKIGGELRADIFRFRTGFAYFTHPLAGIDDVNRNKRFITFGAGMKLPEYYIDAAIVHSGHNSYYSPYSLNSGQEPTVDNKHSALAFHFTWGTYF